MKQILCALFLLGFMLSARGEEVEWHAGAAAIDITPTYPIRLSGFGARKTESEGVGQKIWAKALSLQTSSNGPVAVIITVDNCGVTASIRTEISRRLFKAGVSGNGLAICSTHTHSAPLLAGALPNLFSGPISEKEESTVEGYTKELIEKIEKVARQALSNSVPANLSWGEGMVSFAKNRRTAGGPVHHNLPLLRVETKDAKLLALFANYACHCTTLTGDWNKVHGDWAGIAQEEIERSFPGVVGMIAIGCGADSNPFPRGKLEYAEQYGKEIASEVSRLLAEKKLTPITEPLVCKTIGVELPFNALPTREQWEERAKQSGIVGYHAKRNLERLNKGEKLPETLPYLVQAFNFGDQLSMIFLPGEVVVDYVLRLKSELDGNRLWVNAYANDVPCYIPSKRILTEGGYEAETSLWYYDKPARLAPATEDIIIKAVHEVAGENFKKAAR